MSSRKKPNLHCVVQESRMRAEIARIGYSIGHHVEVYSDLTELMAHPPRSGLIVMDEIACDGSYSHMLDLLANRGIWTPVILFGTDPQPGQIVEAVKAGVLDYLALPIDVKRFDRCLQRVADEFDYYSQRRREMVRARRRISKLSEREGQVLDQLVQGQSNKLIARELQISPRTVEIHRANMMHKLGANHAAEAVRIKLEAQMDRASAL